MQAELGKGEELVLAVAAGELARVEAALAAGADASDAKVCPGGWAPLLVKGGGISQQAVPIMAALQKAGADMVSQGGAAELMAIAARTGRMDVIQWLFDVGVSPGDQRSAGGSDTPLEVARRNVWDADGLAMVQKMEAMALSHRERTEIGAMARPARTGPSTARRM